MAVWWVNLRHWNLLRVIGVPRQTQSSSGAGWDTVSVWTTVLGNLIVIRICGEAEEPVARNSLNGCVVPCHPNMSQSARLCWLNDLAPAMGHIFLGGLWENVSACQCQNRPTRRDRVHTQETTARLNCVTHPCCDECSWTCCDCQGLNVGGVCTLVVSNNVPAWHFIVHTNFHPWDNVSAIVRTHQPHPQTHRLTKSRSRSSNNVGSGPLGWSCALDDLTRLRRHALAPGCDASPMRTPRSPYKGLKSHCWSPWMAKLQQILLVATAVLPGTLCRWFLRPRLASQPPMPRRDRLDVQSTPAFLPCDLEWTLPSCKHVWKQGPLMWPPAWKAAPSTASRSPGADEAPTLCPTEVVVLQQTAVVAPSMPPTSVRLLECGTDNGPFRIQLGQMCPCSGQETFALCDLRVQRQTLLHLPGLFQRNSKSVDFPTLHTVQRLESKFQLCHPFFGCRDRHLVVSKRTCAWRLHNIWFRLRLLTRLTLPRKLTRLLRCSRLLNWPWSRPSDDRDHPSGASARHPLRTMTERDGRLAGDAKEQNKTLVEELEPKWPLSQNDSNQNRTGIWKFHTS